jgi:hypothetical protein
MVVGRPARHLGDDTVEAQLAEIEHIDERVDHANRIALVDEIIEAFRQQRRLPAISPLNEPLDDFTQCGEGQSGCWALSSVCGARRRRALTWEFIGDVRPISAFDGSCVRLRQVAALLAQERPPCAFEDVMDLLKRSVFAGEFEPPSFGGKTREDPRNRLHMEFEALRCTQRVTQWPTRALFRQLSPAVSRKAVKRERSAAFL